MLINRGWVLAGPSSLTDLESALRLQLNVQRLRSIHILFLTLRILATPATRSALPCRCTRRMTMLTVSAIRVWTSVTGSLRFVTRITALMCESELWGVPERIAASEFLRLAPTVRSTLIVVGLWILFITTWLGCTCRVPCMRLWTDILLVFLMPVGCVLRCMIRGRPSRSLVVLLTAMTCLPLGTNDESIPSAAAPFELALLSTSTPSPLRT